MRGRYGPTRGMASCELVAGTPIGMSSGRVGFDSHDETRSERGSQISLEHSRLSCSEQKGQVIPTFSDLLGTLNSVTSESAKFLEELYTGPSVEDNLENPPELSKIDSLHCSIGEFVDVWSPVDFQRGGFCLIDDNRISLPSQPLCTPETWLPLLSAERRALSSDKGSGLVDSFLKHIKANAQWSDMARVYALLGHYSRVISRASLSGMISWESMANLTEESLQIYNAATMTSFAVRKDTSTDRLISWPRTQNDHFLSTPEIDLPDPSLFFRL